MTKAAIYTRVSTEDQAREGVSLDGQERILRDRATADGAEVVGHYEDVLSGAKADRPEYVRMLAAATAGELDVVYVWKYDRLGRDAEERLRARRMLTAADVRLISATESEDELLYGITAVLDQHERKKIAERTAMGLREVGRSGRWRGGQPPLGYRLADHRLVIVPVEAQVVRRIFEEYLAGKGQNRIASSLNADGITTRRGARFSPRVVIELLQNRAYLGEIASHGETLCADAHEAIIDAETFDRAQRLRATRTTNKSGGRGRPAKRHLLDGLLRCPQGHAMLARRNPNGWEHYRCCDRHSGGTCTTPAVGRKKVDETLLHHFLNRHYDEAAERERLLAAAQAKGAESRELAAQADREEQEAEDALVRIRRDYQRGAITAEDWHAFRAELEEDAKVSRGRAQQLRVQAAQLEAEAAPRSTRRHNSSLGSRASSPPPPARPTTPRAWPPCAPPWPPRSPTSSSGRARTRSWTLTRTPQPCCLARLRSSRCSAPS